MTEDWHKPNASSSAAALSAAFSSVLTKSLLYPIDTLKTRLQVGLLRPSSLTGLYAGLVPKLVLYGPYQSLYMAVYTSSREVTQKRFPGPLGFMIAGASAELTASVIRVPMEVVKQRMQAGDKDGVVKILSRVGVRGWMSLWRAQTLFHDLPYGVFQWGLYEVIVRNMEISSPSVWLGAGVIAGGTAAFLTTPLDVIKTRIITRSVEYHTPYQTFQEIYKNEGVAVFSKGAFLRVLHVAPATGIYFFLFNSLYPAAIKVVGNN